MKLALALPLAALAFAGQAFAQTRWDLPAAYPASNFHSENLVQFANDVDKASGGKLKITVHPNASLFKAPDIKRAVQGNQAQIGEILLVNFQNEWPIFGADGMVPGESSGRMSEMAKAPALPPHVSSPMQRRSRSATFSTRSAR